MSKSLFHNWFRSERKPQPRVVETNYQTGSKTSVTLLALSIGLAAYSYDRTAAVSVTPQYFSDSPGVTLSSYQRFSNAYANSPWMWGYHIEIGTDLASNLHSGNHSIDLDRAWYRSPFAETNLGGEITWGRIHPWEVSLNPESLRPWGLAGSLQGQNRGVSLGPVTNHSNFPSPTLLGWVGVHYWSDPVSSDSFQWGLSMTPITIPTMGSSFEFGNNSSHTRFGRTGGTIQTESGTLPIRFEADNSTARNIIAQPQVMIQSYWDLNRVTLGLENWSWISNAPRPNPLLGAVSRIDTSTGQSVAVVSPLFPRQWTVGNTTQWSPGNYRGYSFFSTLLYQDDPNWGFEVGAKNRFVRFSYLNQFGNRSVPESRYTGSFMQYEGQYPLGQFTPYWGAKHHMALKDAWFRTGVRTSIGRDTSLDVGADIFAGATGSYFSQWQDNDRIYATLTWDLGG
ncbi:MAG: hypothetical protein HYR96_06985 [Deltaproteobacteria bacterium]|nr:hypothetical protein [Deltaproteobacteria bacterium]MBI3295354.1 hypothetical protein [Deltaproteobacteria bacterium]